MSETPRTDAVEWRSGKNLADCQFVVFSEFARQLEAELADKEKQLAEARAEIERKDKLLSIVGEVANNALYFNDNSDYEKALWEILAAAKPELFAECEMPRLKFISTSNETAKKGN